MPDSEPINQQNPIHCGRRMGKSGFDHSGTQRYVCKACRMRTLSRYVRREPSPIVLHPGFRDVSCVLTINKYTVLIDTADACLIGDHRWSASLSNLTRYAVAANGVKMHRLIIADSLNDSLQVDHKNHNGLDNRRLNLRAVTGRQNVWNRTARADSGYKGVTRRPNGRFTAAFNSAGTHHALGTYDTAEEAARAYDAGITKYRGEFAWLNFPQVIAR